MFGSEYITMLMIFMPVLVLALLYVIRHPAHRLIEQLAAMLHGFLRMAAKSCLQAEQRIRLRNYELTKSLVETVKERQLERRFMRIEKLVERDLANYEVIAAEINQHLATMDDDYKASANVPKISMDWVAAVEAVASLKEDQRNSEAVSKILEDMHVTVKKHHSELMREHRWIVASRHKLLSRLQGHWRSLSKKLEVLDTNITSLRQRLQRVDQHMEQFEMLTQGSGQGVMASILMRFILSLTCVVAGVVIAWINLELLYEPLSQALSVNVYNNLPLPLILASLHLVMTLMAATMLWESQRITHFFPLIGAMSARTRQLMLVSGLCILCSLVIMEAIALFLVPSSQAIAPAMIGSQWLLACLGIMMPVMLTLLLIPLEYFLYTIRPVFGSGVQISLHLIVSTLRILGNLAMSSAKVSVKIYDLAIFLPLMAEEQWRKQQALQSDNVSHYKSAASDNVNVGIPGEVDQEVKTLSLTSKTSKEHRH